MEGCIATNVHNYKVTLLLVQTGRHRLDPFPSGVEKNRDKRASNLFSISSSVLGSDWPNATKINQMK